MGICREIYQEGVRIPPVKIIRRGVVDREIMAARSLPTSARRPSAKAI